MDCGLNREKLRVSLEKEIGRTGTFRSRPLDRDLRDQVCCALDLIRAVASRSGDQEGFGRAERRRWSPESSSAAALRRRWPISAFPGSIRPGFGSRAVYATRVMHLGTQLGSGRTATASVATAAGLLGGAHRGCTFSPFWVRLWAGFCLGAITRDGEPFWANWMADWAWVVACGGAGRPWVAGVPHSST